MIEEKRPVELVNLYLVGDKGSPDLHLLPTLVDGRPNPEANRLDAESLRVAAAAGPTRAGRGAASSRRTGSTSSTCSPRRTCCRRSASSSAVPRATTPWPRCLDAGVRLTTPEERERIREIVEARTAGLSRRRPPRARLPAVAAGLEAGVAAHHAGMVPPFKEAVEACFAAGLVKVVFATETLALGINMPARTVVIEKLSKFTGERHEFLTPGDYTQLTGRAGRRGIDPVGHAVVLWSPFVPFEQVAALAASRSFRLTSAFRPTYNMAANLVQRYEPGEAHHLLNLSFAQYQADASVVAMEARLEKRAAALAERPRRRRRCERGSWSEYAALRPGRGGRAPQAESRPGGDRRGRGSRSSPATSSTSTAPVGRARCDLRRPPQGRGHRGRAGAGGHRATQARHPRRRRLRRAAGRRSPRSRCPSPYLPNSTRFRLAMAGRRVGAPPACHGGRTPATDEPTPPRSTPPVMRSPRTRCTPAPTATEHLAALGPACSGCGARSRT